MVKTNMCLFRLVIRKVLRVRRPRIALVIRLFIAASPLIGNNSVITVRVRFILQCITVTPIWETARLRLSSLGEARFVVRGMSILYGV